MEQRQSTTATLRHTGLRPLGHSASDLRPTGGPGSCSVGPTLGVVPGRRLGRQATLAKGYRLLQPPAALPLFDMSVAVIDSLNLMRASIEEEVVMQSALAVPAHQALACRIEAYGTPFGAPPLHTVAHGEMTELDKQFAACLAAPPDSDAIASATPEYSLQRMASLSALQRSPSLAAREEAPATPASAAKAARAGELVRSPSIQTDRKKQKGQGTFGPDARRDSGAITDSMILALTEEQEEEAAATAAAAQAAAAPRTPAAVTTALSLGSEGLPPATPPPRAREQQQVPFGAPALFEGCADAVAALVGTGYLLLRAAGFSGQAPRAVERLSADLRRITTCKRLASTPAPLGHGAIAARAWPA